MVVFTCQHCGESLRKPSVEKHYTQTKCRFNTPNLTCVDCLKDFFGDDFAGHTLCVTEDQKYSAKGTVFKEAKGKKKQELYVQIIQSLLLKQDITYKQRQLLDAIQHYDNVPRKWKPFQNFLKSSPAKYLKISADDVKSVFNLIDSAAKREMESTSKENSLPLNKSLESKEENKSSDEQKEEKLSVPNKKMETDEKGNAEAIKENLDGLSRKELKRKRKHEKYLKELENAQTEILPEMPMEGAEDENNSDLKGKKSKKSKKNKLKGMLETTEGKLEEVSGNVHVLANGTNSKKSKKRKLDNSDSVEIEEKRSKISPTENQMDQISDHIPDINDFREAVRKVVLKRRIESCPPLKKRKKTELFEKEKATKIEDVDETDAVQTSFDWSDVIFRVLDSKPEKELSLKKLAKKVVNEYLTVKPDHRSYEELMAKFNKKVKKTRNVRVLKDRAKLIVE